MPRSVINWSAALNFSPITPKVQQHLTKTYAALAAMLLFATLGSIVDIQYNVGGFLAFIGGIALIFALAFTPSTPENDLKRTAMLMGFAFLEGTCLGDLLQLVYEIDPQIISTAFLGTTCVFVCFSVSAMFASRRHLLYLAAFLSSAISLLFWVGLANMFFRSALVYAFQLYAGLMIFCAFVIFDTQLIIEKASLGSTDYQGHALELFLDFVNIFVRIMIILAKESKKKKNSK